MAEIEKPGCLAASAKVPGATKRAARGIVSLLSNYFYQLLKTNKSF
jgi:hypothetical protein